MGLEKLLARDALHEVEISTGSGGSESWASIGGLTDIKPDSDKSDTDSTTRDDAGWASHVVAQRSRTMQLTGYYLEDPDSGDQDEGQKALIDLGDEVGYDALGSFRVTTLGGNKIEFDASAKVVWGDGGLNDEAGFTCDLTINGQPKLTLASDSS
jgi:hypothetical protein